jgi:hypothetical protein
VAKRFDGRVFTPNRSLAVGGKVPVALFEQPARLVAVGGNPMVVPWRLPRRAIIVHRH